MPPALKTWILPDQAMSRDFVYPPAERRILSRCVAYWAPSLTGELAKIYPGVSGSASARQASLS